MYYNSTAMQCTTLRRNVILSYNAIQHIATQRIAIQKDAMEFDIAPDIAIPGDRT